MQSRSSFQIMRDSVFALLMREIKTRFGTSRLGYFWAVGEPILQASILAVIFTLLGRNSISGVPVSIFMITGVLPFNLFSKLINALIASVKANKSLFVYRQVSPIDPFIARYILEMSIYFIVFMMIMLGLWWMGINVLPADPLKVLLSSMAVSLLASGLGLVFLVIRNYWDDATKIVSLSIRPLFFVSGVFFTSSIIPQKYIYLFEWNPLFHAIELIREGMFSSFHSQVASFNYVLMTALVLNVIGLMMYYLNKDVFRFK